MQTCPSIAVLWEQQVFGENSAGLHTHQGIKPGGRWTLLPSAGDGECHSHTKEDLWARLCSESQVKKKTHKPEAASNNPPPCFGTGKGALQVCLEGKPLATWVIREAEWEGLVVPIHLCMAPTPGTCIGRRKPPPGPFCRSIPPVPPLPLCSHQFVSWKQEQESTPWGCPAAVHLTEKRRLRQSRRQ